jgi:hypothetical protein
VSGGDRVQDVFSGCRPYGARVTDGNATQRFRAGLDYGVRCADSHGWRSGVAGFDCAMGLRCRRLKPAQNL